MSVGVCLLCAILAQPAAAQKRGTAPPDWDKLAKTSSPSSAPQILTKKDMEEMDPLRRIVDKRKDLKLTDAQLARLNDLASAGNTRDASLHEAMDSLRKELRPAGGGRPSDEQRLRLTVTREQFVKVVASLRANYASDGAAAVALLEEAQRPVATELLEKQRVEADETISQKMRSGPAGGSGGRPPGSR